MMEKITLSNGLRICNLASPHEFRFTDGTVLNGADEATCREYSASPIEIENLNPGGWTDIDISFQLSGDLAEKLQAIQDDDVDIIIVSLPTMSAIKAAGMEIGKFRTCRLADRVQKTVFTDRFCK
jgi:hypothetical protein